jgi:hypothetical protein
MNFVAFTKRNTVQSRRHEEREARRMGGRTERGIRVSDRPGVQGRSKPDSANNVCSNPAHADTQRVSMVKVFKPKSWRRIQENADNERLRQSKQKVQ